MPDEQPKAAEPTPQDLQNMGEIRAKLESAGRDLDKVRKTVEEIDAYNQIFLDLKNTLSDSGSGMSASLEAAQKARKEIDVVKISSDEGLKGIQDAVSSVKTQIEEIDATYKSFKILKENVENPESGLKAVLVKATDLKEQIEKLRQDAETKLQSVQGILDDATKKTDALNTTFNDFNVTKSKIDDPNTGLVAILASSTSLSQEIVAVKGQADTLYEEIKKFRDESQGYTKDIANLKSQAEKDTVNIKELEKQSEDHKDKIVQIYKIATGAGLANSFDSRKREIEKSAKSWFKALIVGTIVLLGVVLWIYISSSEKGILDGFLFLNKVTFSSPVIFFVIFATGRYTHERSLLEKYAFKAATALALESYTTLLRNTFKDPQHEEKILSFVLVSMETIYKEPFEAKQESKWSLGVNSKLGDIKAELAEVKEEIVTKLAKTD